MNDVKKYIQQIVIHHISEYTDVAEENITVSMTLGKDLGVTSFDLISLAYELEEELDSEGELDIPRNVETVNDIIEFVNKIFNEKRS